MKLRNIKKTMLALAVISLSASVVTTFNLTKNYNKTLTNKNKQDSTGAMEILEAPESGTIYTTSSIRVTFKFKLASTITYNEIDNLQIFNNEERIIDGNINEFSIYPSPIIFHGASDIIQCNLYTRSIPSERKVYNLRFNFPGINDEKTEPVQLIFKGEKDVSDYVISFSTEKRDFDYNEEIFVNFDPKTQEDAKSVYWNSYLIDIKTENPEHEDLIKIDYPNDVNGQISKGWAKITFIHKKATTGVKIKIKSKESSFKFDETSITVNLNYDLRLSFTNINDLSNEYRTADVISFKSISNKSNFDFENDIEFKLFEEAGSPLNINDYFVHRWTKTNYDDALVTFTLNYAEITKKNVKLTVVYKENPSVLNQEKIIKINNEASEPTSITSNDPDTNTIDINKSIDFVLDFTGPEGYIISNEKIKLYEKEDDASESTPVYFTDYSMVINDVPGNKNKKIAKVTFKSIKTYKKITFNYAISSDRLIKDSSAGRDINVEEKMSITLSSDYDFEQKLAYGKSITFKLETNKEIQWKNSATGVKFVVTDNNEEIVNNDLYKIEWDDGKITNNKAEFKFTSNKKNFSDKTIKLKVVKIDDTSIESTTQEIKLFDEQQLILELKTQANLNTPIRRGDIIEFTLRSTKEFHWQDEDNGAKFIFLDSENTPVSREKYFEFAWVKDSINTRTAKFTLKSIKENKDLVELKLKVVKANQETFATETKTIKLFDQPEPSEINSSLVIPETTKVDVNDTVEFALRFTGETNYAIHKDKIKLFEKNLEDSADKIVNKENYSMVISDVEENADIKLAKVTFLKPYNYSKLVFNYVIDEKNIIRDSSEGIDLEVAEPKLVLELNTKADLEKTIRKGESILFALKASKNFDWKNQETGAKFELTNSTGDSINLEDYFDFIWVEDSINADSAQFILTSKFEHNELISVSLKVVKADDKTISTESKIIKLFDDKPNPDEKDSSANTAIIAGAASGAGVVAIAGAAGATIFIRKKRK